MKYLIPFAMLSIVFIFGFLGLPSTFPDKDNSPDYSYLANEIVNGITDCEQQSMWWICLEDLAKELYRTYSPQGIFAAIALVENERVIFSHCHRMGHFWGREIYKHTQSMPEALDQASFICTGGSLHGVVEGYVIEQQWEEITDEKLREFVLTVCQNATSDSVHALHDECTHGIGHALMFLTGNDLPLSLKLCDALPVSSISNFGNLCYTGVFMENNLETSDYDITPSGHVSDYRSRPDDPLYPCSILEEQYLPRCYQFKADLSIRLTNDFNETMEWCLQVPDQYQFWCFLAVGEWASRRIQDYAQVKAICDEASAIGSSSARISCINGVVSDIVEKYGGEDIRLHGQMQLPHSQKHLYYFP